jgi:hypothetical protein
VYNLNYTPTTLLVQSFNDLTSGGGVRELQMFNTAAPQEKINSSKSKLINMKKSQLRTASVV